MKSAATGIPDRSAIPASDALGARAAYAFLLLEYFDTFKHAAATEMITRPEMEENWDTIRSAVRSRWPVLGDEELEEARHSVGRVHGVIQQRTGESPQVVEQFLNSVACPVRSFFRNPKQALKRAAVPAAVVAPGVGFLVGLLMVRMLSTVRD